MTFSHAGVGSRWHDIFPRRRGSRWRGAGPRHAGVGSNFFDTLVFSTPCSTHTRTQTRISPSCSNLWAHEHVGLREHRWVCEKPLHEEQGGQHWRPERGGDASSRVGGGSAAGVGQRAPVCLVAGFVPASSADSPPVERHSPPSLASNLIDPQRAVRHTAPQRPRDDGVLGSRDDGPFQVGEPTRAAGALNEPTRLERSRRRAARRRVFVISKRTSEGCRPSRSRVTASSTQAAVLVVISSDNRRDSCRRLPPRRTRALPVCRAPAHRAVGHPQRLGCMQGEWGRDCGEKRVGWPGASARRGPSSSSRAHARAAQPTINMDVCSLLCCAHPPVL